MLDNDREYNLLGFREFLMFFCAYYAEAQRLMDDAKSGRPFNERRLAYAVLQQKNMKAHFLDYLGRCAFGGGLRFVTDTQSFTGFDIKGGRLIRGTKEAVYEQTEKFYQGFPDSFDVYKYEVAVFARSLTGRGFFDTADWLSEDNLFPYPEIKLTPLSEGELRLLFADLESGGKKAA